MSSDEPQLRSRSPMLRWIMLAVLAWGLILALGGYRFGGNQPLLKAFIIAGCVIAFLTFWLVALGLRKRRMHNE